MWRANGLVFWPFCSKRNELVVACFSSLDEVHASMIPESSGIGIQSFILHSPNLPFMFLVTGCCTEVEFTPHNWEIVGSNPIRSIFLPIFCSNLKLLSTFFRRWPNFFPIKFHCKKLIAAEAINWSRVWLICFQMIGGWALLFKHSTFKSVNFTISNCKCGYQPLPNFCSGLVQIYQSHCRHISFTQKATVDKNSVNYHWVFEIVTIKLRK